MYWLSIHVWGQIQVPMKSFKVGQSLSICLFISASDWTCHLYWHPHLSIPNRWWHIIGLFSFFLRNARPVNSDFHAVDILKGCERLLEPNHIAGQHHNCSHSIGTGLSPKPHKVHFGTPWQWGAIGKACTVHLVPHLTQWPQGFAMWQRVGVGGIEGGRGLQAQVRAEGEVEAQEAVGDNGGASPAYKPSSSHRESYWGILRSLPAISANIEQSEVPHDIQMWTNVRLPKETSRLLNCSTGHNMGLVALLHKLGWERGCLDIEGKQGNWMGWGSSKLLF